MLIYALYKGFLDKKDIAPPLFKRQIKSTTALYNIKNTLFVTVTWST